MHFKAMLSIAMPGRASHHGEYAISDAFIIDHWKSAISSAQCSEVVEKAVFATRPRTLPRGQRFGPRLFLGVAAAGPLDGSTIGGRSQQQTAL